MSQVGQFCFVLFQCLNQLYRFTFIRLFTLFSLALVLTWVLSRGEATADRLFQSPISPLVEPPPVEQEFIPEPPPAEPEIVPAQPVEEQAPVEPIPAEVQPAPVQPAEVDPNSFVSPVSTPAVPRQAEAPLLPEPEPVSPRGNREDRLVDEEAEGDTSLILDRAEFVDTLVVSTAYVWLCCGVIIFLTIPLVFLFLQIRGRTKISREDLY